MNKLFVFTSNIYILKNINHNNQQVSIAPWENKRLTQSMSFMCIFEKVWAWNQPVPVWQWRTTQRVKIPQHCLQGQLRSRDKLFLWGCAMWKKTVVVRTWPLNVWAALTYKKICLVRDNQSSLKCDLTKTRLTAWRHRTCVTLALGCSGLMTSCLPVVYRILSESGPQATEYTGEPGQHAGTTLPTGDRRIGTSADITHSPGGRGGCVEGGGLSFDSYFQSFSAEVSHFSWALTSFSLQPDPQSSRQLGLACACMSVCVCMRAGPKAWHLTPSPGACGFSHMPAAHMI